MIRREKMPYGNILSELELRAPNQRPESQADAVRIYKKYPFYSNNDWSICDDNGISHLVYKSKIHLTADMLFGWDRPARAYLFWDKDQFRDFCQTQSNINEASLIKNCIHASRYKSEELAVQFVMFLNAVCTNGNYTPIGKNPGGPPTKSSAGFENDGPDYKLFRITTEFSTQKMIDISSFETPADMKRVHISEIESVVFKTSDEFFNANLLDVFRNNDGYVKRIATGKSIKDWIKPIEITESYLINYFTEAVKAINRRNAIISHL